jgi:hypothetical protein
MLNHSVHCVKAKLSRNNCEPIKLRKETKKGEQETVPGVNRRKLFFAPHFILGRPSGCLLGVGDGRKGNLFEKFFIS